MIDWSKQHCGVHQATWSEMLVSMPDLGGIISSFPELPSNFTWDVKVHMLMPNQYPCIPNWHFDNIPRVNNKQDFALVRPDLPMYLWVSDSPTTEFRKDGEVFNVPAQEWHRFTQEDEHRGTMATKFGWRGFIRATHKDILPANKAGGDKQRRHSQVYLDSSNFSW